LRQLDGLASLTNRIPGRVANAAKRGPGEVREKSFISTSGKECAFSKHDITLAAVMLAGLSKSGASRYALLSG
jgi:hypothetical protein